MEAVLERKIKLVKEIPDDSTASINNISTRISKFRQ